MKYQKFHSKIIQRMIKKYLKKDICPQKKDKKDISDLRLK